MEIKELLIYWHNEMIAAKMELNKISWLISQGVKMEKELDAALDRYRTIERIIKELEKKK